MEMIIEKYAVDYQTLKSAKELSKQSQILNLPRASRRLPQGQFKESKMF